jgi:hypothetical protein
MVPGVDFTNIIHMQLISVVNKLAHFDNTAWLIHAINNGRAYSASAVS